MADRTVSRFACCRFSEKRTDEFVFPWRLSKKKTPNFFVRFWENLLRANLLMVYLTFRNWCYDWLIFKFLDVHEWVIYYFCWKKSGKKSQQDGAKVHFCNCLPSRSQWVWNLFKSPLFEPFFISLLFFFLLKWHSNYSSRTSDKCLKLNHSTKS